MGKGLCDDDRDGDQDDDGDYGHSTHLGPSQQLFGSLPPESKFNGYTQPHPSVAKTKTHATDTLENRKGI